MGQTTYAYISPISGDTYLDQYINCISQVKLDTKSFCKINVFATVSSNDKYQQLNTNINTWMHKHHPNIAPRVSLIAQAPNSDKLLAIELIQDRERPQEHHTRSISGAQYDVYLYKDHTLVAASACCGNVNDNTKTQSIVAFEKVKQILDNEQLNFGDIVRQWNYIENIIGYEGENQIYQTFNDIRAHYYADAKFKHGYPAATGIGQQAGGVIIDFIAIKSTPHHHIFPVHNPAQIDAHQYSNEVLLGDTQSSKSPKFERAKLLTNTKECRVLISGTAAIIGENSIPSFDIEQQVTVTMNNIKQLIHKDFLAQISRRNLDLHQGHFVGLRAYVRRKEDLDKVKTMCDSYRLNTPITIVQADICRDNLYVEIEGEYCLKRLQ